MFSFLNIYVILTSWFYIFNIYCKEVSLMKGNYRNRSPLTQKIMSKAYKKQKITYRLIASRTIQPEESIRCIFEEGALPSNYLLFKNVCSMINLSDKDLKKLETSDPVYIFTYWDELYPKAPSSDYFGVYLKTLYEEKGFTRQDIIKATGKTPACLSQIFNGKTKLTYPTLSSVLDIIGVTPEEFLDGYKTSSFESYSYQFSELLYKSRKALGMSKKDVADYCNINPKRYEKIESGSVSVFKGELSKISEILELPLKNLESYADRAGILGERSQAPKAKTKLWDLLAILSSYKYIDTDTDKVEGHTLVVLLFLILLNKEDKYRSYLMYYLNELYSSENLARKLYFPSNREDLDFTGVLNMYREAEGYTYATLSKVSGVSSAAIYDFLSGRSIPYIKTITSICDYLNAPLPLALEYIVGDDEPSRDTAELVDVYATINSSLLWTYEDIELSSDTVAEIFHIIFSKDNALGKYLRLSSLNLFTE